MPRSGNPARFGARLSRRADPLVTGVQAISFHRKSKRHERIEKGVGNRRSLHQRGADPMPFARYICLFGTVLVLRGLLGSILFKLAEKLYLLNDHLTLL